VDHCQYYLRQGWIFPLVFLISLALAAGCATRTDTPPTYEEEVVKESAGADHHVLRDIRVIDLEVHFDLLRSGSRDIYYSAFKAIDPLRLVLDLPNTVEEKVPSPLAVENEIIGKIETTTLEHESQPLTRIEIGLNRDTAYLIDQAQAEIWVQFYADPQLSEAAVARGEPVVHPEVEAHPPEEEAPQPTGAPQPAAEEPLAAPRPAAEEQVAASQSIAEEPTVDPPPAAEEPLAAPPPAAEELLSPANRILNIEPITTGEGLAVHIIGNGKLENYHAFVLRNPPRLVLDLVGVRSSQVKNNLSLVGPRVKSIRVGLHASKVRVVFDLNFIPRSEIPYHIIEVKDRLVITFE